MKLIINNPLNLSYPLTEVESVLTMFKNLSVHSKQFGTGEVRTLVLNSQKIVLGEQYMSELLPILDSGASDPLCLEYAGYDLTFELYKKGTK
jgi:hypothetical protein